MNAPPSFWDNLLQGPDAARILNAAMDRAAAGLSGLTGRPVANDPPQVKRMALDEVAAGAADPEAPAVGVYLKMEGGMVGWALLSIPLDLALRMASWVMGVPAGSSTRLGKTQRSALAEAGNLVLAYFLNSVAEQTHAVQALLPSPPVVVVDMLGVILNLLITPTAAMGDTLVVVETAFHDVGQSAAACFWVAPEMEPERV